MRYKRLIFTFFRNCFYGTLSGTFIFLLFAGNSFSQSFEMRDKIPASVLEEIGSGAPQELIILFDDSAIQKEAAEGKEAVGSGEEAMDIPAWKASRYGELKQRVMSELPLDEIEIVSDYSHLPMMFVKVKSYYALEKLALHSGVVRIFKNEMRKHFLAQSLPLIHQPQVVSLGIVGTGTAVAVLDTGVNYTLSAFGSCTAPNTPASCKVIYAQDFAPNDGFLDDNGHGTNVAGIALGVAPDTRIIALDVFRTDGYAYDSDIIAAINWCISNQATYNIVAMNMSFGGSFGYTSPCTFDGYATPVAQARSAGILSAISSGNEARTNALASPACVPAAVSVGAVYDSNIGAQYWSNCIDLTTAADKVTCFSNSASFLTMLAPGALITAAGITYGGTSQAAPHIAGSIAVLRGTGGFPSETVDDTVNRMAGAGVPVYDSRNGITKPRIDLLASVTSTGTFSISGTVRTSGGSPISNVTMTLSGAASGTTTTNILGNYSFSALGEGGYTITPSRTGYTFTPPDSSVTIIDASITGVNFTGAVVPTYSISGTVYTYGRGGTLVPFYGVTMTLSGAAAGTATTNSLGSYSFTGLVNGQYTVTPTKTGYSFIPTSSAVTVNGVNISGQNFIGFFGTVTTYSISGTVRTAAGSPISGVTMTLGGAASRTTTTDGLGNYSFTGLINGVYSVTPGLSGYTFTPPNRSVTINSMNVTGQDFVGTPSAPTYSISGTVRTAAGSPISSVTMTLTGAASRTTTTDINGNYSFSSLVNGQYTITPARTGYTFAPSSITVIVSGVNISGQDFIGTPPAQTYSLSGTVILNGRKPMPLSGVTMTLSGAASKTTLTDANGNYLFTGLSDGSYTITPSKTGYTFTPASINRLISGSNVTGVNFSSP